MVKHFFLVNLYFNVLFIFFFKKFICFVIYKFLWFHCLGFSLTSPTLPSHMHRHLKYPFQNYHCTPLAATPYPPGLSVDRFLLPNPIRHAHFQGSHLRSECLVDPTNPKITSIPPPNVSSLDTGNISHQSKRKRSWSRAVFSQLQRKGLEIQFQIQKYITKPDRRKLAARLGLTDAQVS